MYNVHFLFYRIINSGSMITLKVKANVIVFVRIEKPDFYIFQSCMRIPVKIVAVVY